MPILSKRTIAIALCTFGVAACSSGDNSSLTAPPTVAASVADQVETQTVAEVSVENASESVDVINDAELSADGGGTSFDLMASTAVGPRLVSASFMAPVPGASASVVVPHGNCPFDAATSFHVCATSTDGMGLSTAGRSSSATRRERQHRTSVTPPRRPSTSCTIAMALCSTQARRACAIAASTGPTT